LHFLNNFSRVGTNEVVYQLVKQECIVFSFSNFIRGTEVVLCKVKIIHNIFWEDSFQRENVSIGFVRVSSPIIRRPMTTTMSRK